MENKSYELQNAKKLKIVWDGYHHDCEVIQTPTCIDGVLVVHVSTDSMKELLNADNPYEDE